MQAILMFLAGLAAMAAGAAQGQIIGFGNAQHTATLRDTTLKVFSYRPEACEARQVLIVFHGSERDAEHYRDTARPLADKLCAVIVAPEFDRRRFPDDQYQLGGVVRGGEYVRDRRPLDLVEPLISWARTALDAGPDFPVVLFAHSAGAQFIGRAAAFASTGNARIVLINPSTWVVPSADIAVPYGFGGTGTPESIATRMRSYLAQPLTVLLGTADTGTANLARDASAMAQGPNRLERGRNTFELAEKASRERGWAFGWRKIEARGSGHREMEMFNTSAAVDAIR